MNFSLTSEQTLLQTSVQRFVETHYAWSYPESKVTEEIRRQRWQQVCELGWLAAGLPEAMGGAGGSIIDTIVIAEKLGAGPAIEPFTSTLLSASILSQATTTSASQALTALIGGQSLVSLALYEPGQRYSQICKQTSLAGELLNGHKTNVLFGDNAENLLIACHDMGSDELVLLITDAKAPGVQIHGHKTIDGHSSADVVLRDVRVSPDNVLLRGVKAQEALQLALNTAIVSLCAEGLGAMETALAQTISYCKDRSQFGQSVSKFQAIQHRLVDMYVLCEGARSLLFAAAIKLKTKHPDTNQAVSALKYRLSESGRKLGEEAVQLHGGMGFTNELPLSRLYKRLVCIAATLGDADHHLHQFSHHRRVAAPEVISG